MSDASPGSRAPDRRGTAAAGDRPEPRCGSRVRAAAPAAAARSRG